MSQPRQRSARPTSPSAKNNGKVTSAPAATSQAPMPCPALDDRDAWKGYWQAQGQVWRTEPEIDPKRQAELAQHRTIVPDIEKGIYPFQGMKLSRADVEWLLATHENGRGPVDWNGESQRKRKGLDLRGADLSQIDLSFLPLTRLYGGLTLKEMLHITPEQLKWAIVYMQGANLSGAQLQGANLSQAQLQEANLSRAQLQEAHLNWAQLQEVNLRYARLDRAHLWGAQLERANLSDARLERANLHSAQLQRADLTNAQLERANLSDARLERAELFRTQLQGATLINARLERANLFRTQLQGADLKNAWLEGAFLDGTCLEGAILEEVILSNKQGTGPFLRDVQWGNANLAVVNWSYGFKLRDERDAEQEIDDDGNKKEKTERLNEYREAVRANRQLAIALQAQGLNEQAVHFAYQAQVLQRHAYWFLAFQARTALRQRLQALRSWLFSWFLYLIAGYSYRPGRSFLAYLLVISGFAFAYYVLGRSVGPTLSPLSAFVFSMTSFHGRGFFPGNNISLDDPLTVLAALEALVGLIIEVTFIATLTQRFFNR